MGNEPGGEADEMVKTAKGWGRIGAEATTPTAQRRRYGRGRRSGRRIEEEAEVARRMGKPEGGSRRPTARLWEEKPRGKRDGRREGRQRSVTGGVTRRWQSMLGGERARQQWHGGRRRLEEARGIGANRPRDDTTDDVGVREETLREEKSGRWRWQDEWKGRRQHLVTRGWEEKPRGKSDGRRKGRW